MKTRIVKLIPLILGSTLPCYVASVARADTDWVLVLDRSESMTQNDPANYRFDAQKIMVDLLAQEAQEIHRLTIIRFAGTPEVVLDRVELKPANLDTVRRTISEDPPKGDTDIGAALAMARSISKAEGRTADVHIILLSDGVLAGKIPNLVGRLEEQKKAFQELGLPVNTILLNDFSITQEEREERRRRKLYYDDRQLQAGEDLMRDLARRSGGEAVQVLPERGVEDILIGLIAPHMSFHRESVTGRLTTWPTDRQLFFVLDRKAREVNLRIAAQDVKISLEKAQKVEGDFEVVVAPYAKRTVLMVRPKENVRWPEWLEVLPTGSDPVLGEVFVISNVRLAATPGFGDDQVAVPEGVRTRIVENEVYPICFRVSMPDDLTPERRRSVEESLKKAVVKVQLTDNQGKQLEEKKLLATDVIAGAGNRVYFVPTSAPGGDAKLRESLNLTVKAQLELPADKKPEAGALRPLSRAPDRSFTVEPSDFDWFVRRNWKGEPESSSRPETYTQVDLELGQELRMELTYSGTGSVHASEMSATFGIAGETAARRQIVKDGGGAPRLFYTDWILPPAPGSYVARMMVKAEAVRELSFKVNVSRDDFRQPGPGGDSAEPAPGDLGTFIQGESIPLSRTRTIHRLTPAATAKYWESAMASPARASLLRKDAASGGWTIAREIPLIAEAPKLGTAEIMVKHQGEIRDLEPGEYLVAWPESRPLAADPAADPRCDKLEVSPRAFDVEFLGQDGKPLATEAGKPTTLAGSKLLIRLTPSKVFPKPFQGSIDALLSWARKDLGEPQKVAAVQGDDGKYTLAFATTDFHIGPARVHISTKWADGGRERSIQEDHEVIVRTKALSVILEPVQENVLIGQRGAAMKFRLRPIGGASSQVQRDLLSVWQSQPASATLADSEQVHSIDLAWEGEALVGSLSTKGLAAGTYKLTLSSPLAKLGQDVAACFFQVLPCPFNSTLVKSSGGADHRALLSPTMTSASCEGEGAVWVSLERASDGKSTADASKVVAAQLQLNAKPLELRWSETEGSFRSEPIAVEGLDRENSISVTFQDDAGRDYEASLGSLKVVPIPLKYEVEWTKAPPAEIQRGEVVEATGIVHIRGSFRPEREAAAKALASAKFLQASPPSGLKSFEVTLLPAGEESATAAFGVRVGFSALLCAAMDDPAQKGTLDLTTVSESGAAIETKSIPVSASSRRLVVARASSQDTTSSPSLPILARERLKVRIEGNEVPGKARIQVLSGEGEGAAEILASSDSTELAWSPKKEGTYKISAEAKLASGSTWAVEDTVTVHPALRLEWARGGSGALKLDDGQKLPLSLRIVGPPNLEKESFDPWFQVRTEILGEGHQPLEVKFTDWELEKGSTPGSIVLNSYSSQALPTGASQVRVSLLDRPEQGTPATIDTLKLDLARGGGTLILVENFKPGSKGYSVKDLSSGFEAPRAEPIRLGYRSSGVAESEDALRHGVVAVVVTNDGKEKVLDVAEVSPGLVIFTPFEPTAGGRHKLKLEIRGKTPLSREFEFEVVKGSSERIIAWIIGGVCGIAGLLFAVFGMRFLRYDRDRREVRGQIRARMDRVLGDLRSQPSGSLSGSVRVTVANRTLGPLELNGNPSRHEVDAWVNQHFPMDTNVFGDMERNEKRKDLIKTCLSEARMRLRQETEKHLPIRSVDICLLRSKDEKGASRFDVQVVHDYPGRQVDADRTLVSLRLQPDGSLRISTPAGKAAVLSPKEDFPYNGWVGKVGGQVKASVKVPGVAEYSTLILDWKA
jgi:hypothetical protein